MSARSKHQPNVPEDDRDAVTLGRIGSGIRLPAAIASKGPPDPGKLARAKEIARAAYENMTDEEDERLVAATLSDRENPLMEEVMERNERRRLGRPPLPRTKRSVHLRLDQEVVDFFVAGGRGWQTRMNAALRKAAGLE
jgi:uncharacterized protein (DUF4415 family)